jgi:hypothetical protein
MDIPDQDPKMDIVVATNGVISSLEDMARAVPSVVKSSRIGSQGSMHDGSERDRARFDQQVVMISEKAIGEYLESALFLQMPKPREESVIV